MGYDVFDSVAVISTFIAILLFVLSTSFSFDAVIGRSISYTLTKMGYFLFITSPIKQL